MAQRMTPRRPAPRLPAIDADRCTGCGRCVAVCAPRVLILEATPDWRKSAVLIAAAGCTGCSLCALKCPFDAIEMRRTVDA
jgi:ferredoxin